MPCQMLNRFGIHSGVDQVRDIRVAKKVRRYRKIDGIDYTRLVPTLLPEFQSDLLLDGLSVHVFVECPFSDAADLDIVPDPYELENRKGARLRCQQSHKRNTLFDIIRSLKTAFINHF